MNQSRTTPFDAHRLLAFAALMLFVTTTTALGARVSLVEDGASQYTITIDGQVLTNANGAPRLFSPLASATEVAKIHLQANPDAKVFITGIQRWQAVYSTKGRKRGTPTDDEPQQPDEPQEPDAPAEPDEPQEPDAPAEPDEPQEPDAPAEPDEPQEPDAPVEPDDPGDLEPAIDFPDRLVAAPGFDLDALTNGAKQIWVAPNGLGDGSSSDNPTTLDMALASIIETDGGHYVVRLENGGRHMLSRHWPSNAAGVSPEKPILLIPANPQGQQPIIVGASGAAGLEFRTPRQIVVHGIQFGSYSAAGVNVVAETDGTADRGLILDGCTFFGSRHGLTVSTAGVSDKRVNVTVRNSLFLDLRRGAVFVTTARNVDVLSNSIALKPEDGEVVVAIDLVGSGSNDIVGNVIADSNGPAVRIDGGSVIEVANNAFVRNAVSGELFNRPVNVEWTGNVTINQTAGPMAAGLCVRSARTSTFSNNLFVNSHGVQGPAIVIGRDAPTGDENITDTVFSDNIIYDAHATAIQVDWVVAENVRFDSNVTQSSSAIAQPSMAAKWVAQNVAAGVSASGDRFALNAVGDAVQVGDASGGYALWTDLTGGNVQTTPVNFVDPKRDAAIYNRVAMEGDESAAGLVEAIRSGSVKADPLVDWVRAGFEVVAGEDEPQDPPAEPEDPPVEPEDPPAEPEDPPVEPEDPPVQPEDPPVPADVIAIYIDAIGGPSSGSDNNDGLSPQTAVATHARAREVAVDQTEANPNAVLSLLFRRGDTFPAFGRLNMGRRDWAGWKWQEMTGRPNQYLVVTGYGSGANPVFEVGGDNESGVILWYDTSYVEVRGIKFQGSDAGGLAIRSISRGHGLRVIDCEMVNASNVITPDTEGKSEGFEFVGNIVRDVYDNSDGHRQGVYVSNCKDWVFSDNVLYRCGWIGTSTTPDDQLKQSTFNHGLYAAASNGPVKSAERNIAIFNSGAGMQFRSAGNVRHNFAAWNHDRGINWGESRGTNTQEVGGWGELTNNVAYCDTGHAIMVANLETGHVHNNTGISAGKAGMVLLAQAEVNPQGGWYRGLNDLIVENNYLSGAASNGGLMLSNDGWNFTGAGKVNVRANQIDGGVKLWTTFADPRGGLNLSGDNEAADMSQHPRPQQSQELIGKILSREITATDLIESYRAH